MNKKDDEKILNDNKNKNKNRKKDENQNQNEDDEGDKKNRDIDIIFEPEFVVSNNSIMIGSQGIKFSQLGFQGLKVELFNTQNLLLDGLRKRGSNYSKDREGKRAWENSVKNAQNLQELRSSVIELEAVVRNLQTVEDENDDAEAEREKEEIRAIMVTEGWRFKEEEKEMKKVEKKEERKEEKKEEMKEERKGRGKRGREEIETVEVIEKKIEKEEVKDVEKEIEKDVEKKNDDYVEQMNYIGMPLRRFFKGHGKSDGVIVGYLPSERNEGMELWRMIHEDGDEEDLDYNDIIKSIRWFNLNLYEDDEINNNGNSNNNNNGDDDDDDEDNDDDIIVDYMEDNNNENEHIDGVSTATLWPSGGVRARWLDALQQSKTISEVVLALSSFLEHSRLFGMMDEEEPEQHTSNNSKRKSSNIITKNNDIKSKSINNVVLSSPYRRRGKRHVEPEMGRTQRAAARRIVSYAE